MKKIVKEEEDENKGGSENYFYVNYWTADCNEDSYEEGEIGGGNNWDSDDFHDTKKKFKSINDAIKHVCEVQGFVFNPKDWEWDEENKCFGTDFLVNADNKEASDEAIDAWKKGEARLWACRVMISMSRIEMRDLLDDEIISWNKTAV